MSLKKGRVIDNNKQWIGGNTQVVQLGDIVDKGVGRGIKCNAKTNGRIFT